MAIALACVIWIPLLVRADSGLDLREMWPAMLFAGFFGGWVGLVSCVCFTIIQGYATRSRPRVIFTFVAFGAGAGAPPFFLFGDGLAMAFGLALEGAVFGGIIGGALGLVFLLIFSRQAGVKSEAKELSNS